MNKKHTYLIVMLLIIAACAAFGRIAGNDFINLDDNLYITENNYIKSGINSESVKWAFSTVDFFYWQPLTWLSHMMDWSLFGTNASGHHVINLILHIGSVLFLFLFLNKTTNNIWPSAFAAAFFALHPLRVESVAWAAERKDVLSMFFGMASIYAYAFYAESSKLSKYFLCLILFALSLMAKPMLVTLPFVLLLLDHWPLGRWSGKMTAPLHSRNRLIGSLWKEKMPFFLLTIVISVVTFWGQKKFGVVVSFDDWPIYARIFNAIISYVSYLGKIFWPVDLAVFYPFEQPFILQQIFNNFFFLIAITIFVIYSINKLPFLFVGWFWYLGTLLPVLGFVQVASQAMADRFTYLPSVGIAIMISWGFVFLFKREESRKNLLFPSAIFILSVLAILTWRQCGYWKNSATLFSHALQVTKNNAQAHNNLGKALFDEGKIEEALDHYNKSINIKPDVIGYLNRAFAYAKINQYPNAIDDFTSSIRLKPDYITYYNRGNAYAKIGQYPNAIADFNKTIFLKPDYVDAFNNRGIINGQFGKYHMAIDDFNKVIGINHNHTKAYNNRGLAYSALRQYKKAIEDFSKAISLKPDYAEAYINKANVYIKLGDSVSGCRDAQKACGFGNCRLLEWYKKEGLCH